MTAIDVLMTSHNRCAKTLACLASLANQHAPAEVRVVLVDAGSSDGTQEQVTAAFPDTLIVRAGTDVFWGQGMRIAGEHARADADFHLWLNDDVVLDPDALSSLLSIGAGDRIVVGKLRDGQGRPTYGGLRVHRLRRLSLTPAAVSADATQVDTMNGNVVLVGRDVVKRIGLVRGDLFAHQFGDVDYGSAPDGRRRVLQAPDTLGICSHNPPWRPYAEQHHQGTLASGDRDQGIASSYVAERLSAQRWRAGAGVLRPSISSGPSASRVGAEDVKVTVTGPIDLRVLQPLLDSEVARPGYSFPMTAHLVHALVDLGVDVSVVGTDPSVTTGYRLQGPRLDVRVVPMRPRARRRAQDFFRAERVGIKQAIEDLRPDVIHAHWTYEFALAAQKTRIPTWSPFTTRAPSILAHHRDAYRSARLAMQVRAITRARYLSAVSPLIQQKVEKIYRKRLALVPNGLPDDYFRRTSRPTSHRVTYGALVNGDDDRKNLRTLLRAFDLLSRVEGKRLVLAGAGCAPGDPLHAWAVERGLDRGVAFRGPMRPTRYPATWRTSTCLCIQPSRNRSEWCFSRPWRVGCPSSEGSKRCRAVAARQRLGPGC